MKRLLSLTLILFLTSCSDDGESKSLTSSSVQTSLPSPFVSGDWYRPSLDTSWQWQLNGKINTSYDVDLYDIDLFDTDTTLIDSLKEEGKKVICYFSAGSYENWREDKDAFPQEALGNTLDGWEDERWLDITNEKLQTVMIARLDLAVLKGCDGVEPDNVDAYDNDSGFALSATDQLLYNIFLANAARERGLSIGLKNDLSQVNELEPYFDFALNEQCNAYNECDLLQPFIDNNKPVFNTEYDAAYVNNTNNKRDILCQNTNELQLRTLILPLNLDDSFRYSCN